MENIIYNELRTRGHKVDIGMIEQRATNREGKVVRKQLEVNFVVNHKDIRGCRLPDIP